MTAFDCRMKRPMSTSIVPSLSSLDHHPTHSARFNATRSKRASIPFTTTITIPPKRGSSASPAGLANSQSRLAQNLLKRFSYPTAPISLHQLSSSSPSSPSSSTQPRDGPTSCSSEEVMVRDFGFKRSDPRHTGHGAPPLSKTNAPPHGDSALHPHHPHQGGNPHNVWDTICASPTGGPGSMDESEEGYYDREQEEEEESKELDKLIFRQDGSGGGEEATIGGGVGVGVSSGMVLDGISELTGRHGNLYVSLYEFVAEGSSEMNLVKGELVCVLEMICDGWVVGQKTELVMDDDGQLFRLDDRSPVLPHDLPSSLLSLSSLTGLCPENYLLKISNI
ncbi:hypothetical protein PCANC_14294 [Puccinia coronata f. sp. avenae]|uniref:SH3 domain-containing protein n=1 Tax=Puccinia coronata f. sp. avenae TaxID=200324 RepID=A0A2N5VLE5_9BASI|nr:hypothetical protein PCASD_17591 [Puccinia coronata f. sp. avenae]PLW50808.1 hypothetical protein PCANC_14294 [Puccinia coronata f. sp. avenae]